MVVYRAIYFGAPRTPVERTAALRGAVFVSVRVDALLAPLLGGVPSHFHACVVDTDPSAPMRRLAGAPGCEAGAAELKHQRAMDFAGRQWSLRVSASKADMPDDHGLNIWLFSLTGLVAAGMLGTLLLLVTGRTRRIEAAVRERTQALQSEVREREVAQAAMRNSEQRLRNILDNVPIGVIYTDLRGNVKQANPRFCELVGYGEEDLLLMTSAEYTHPEDVAQDVELSTQLVNGDIPMYRRHKRYITSDGRAVWVQATVSLLRDARGQPQHIVGAVEDISEHLRLQEAENARELAEASNHAKSEFLSRMSHELRTPLNAMLGFAQLLELDKRHPLAPAQLPWVSQIQQAGWHLLEMINDVLDLSRIESGNLRLQPETLDLVALLDATLAMVAVDAHQRGISITTELAAGTKLVLGDATRVKQILTNLLTNAVKYNSEGGRIHVTSRLRGHGSVEIAVTDTGMGMTPQQVAELFQPFNRLGRERSTLQGTGIGLVISKRLAELMGGTLRARSVTGEGSSFILDLPRVVDPDTVRSDLGDITTTPSDYHARLVHYVEDNETNVEVMRGILAQRPQVQLQVSITGLDGLAAIRARRPDLILLDMHLPDIHGLELLRHLKADPGTAGIAVVVVSADALGQQIDAALNAGAVRYLTKPVSVAELLAVLDELLEHADASLA